MYETLTAWSWRAGSTVEACLTRQCVINVILEPAAETDKAEMYKPLHDHYHGKAGNMDWFGNHRRHG